MVWIELCFSALDLQSSTEQYSVAYVSKLKSLLLSKLTIYIYTYIIIHKYKHIIFVFTYTYEMYQYHKTIHVFILYPYMFPCFTCTDPGAVMDSAILLISRLIPRCKQMKLIELQWKCPKTQTTPKRVYWYIIYTYIYMYRIKYMIYNLYEICMSMIWYLYIIMFKYGIYI